MPSIQPFRNMDTLSLSNRMLFDEFGRGPQVDIPFLLIHDAFEHFADCQPQAIAVDHNGKQITYHELEIAANALANRLINNGLEPRQRVCLVVQRSISMIIGLLAILKCGCQYIPLDGGITPDTTLRHVITDTDARYILCLEKFRERVIAFESSSCGVSVLDDDGSQVDSGSTTRPHVNIGPSDGAYMIYTSGKYGSTTLGSFSFCLGTTGPPKGVDVAHIEATNLLYLYPGNLGIKPGTTVAQCLSISFDMDKYINSTSSNVMKLQG
jgi:non-ribosomal peptide synthetase component F